MGFALAVTALGIGIIGNRDPVSVAFVFDHRAPGFVLIGQIAKASFR